MNQLNNKYIFFWILYLNNEYRIYVYAVYGIKKPSEEGFFICLKIYSAFSRAIAR